MNPVLAKNITSMLSVIFLLLILCCIDFQLPNSLPGIKKYEGDTSSLTIEKAHQTSESSWQLHNSQESYLALSSTPPDPLWFKVPINNNSSFAKEYVLQLDFPIFPETDFYLLEDGHIKAQYLSSTDTKVAIADRVTLQSTKKNFAFSMAADSTYEVFIRLHGHRNFLISVPVSLYEKSQYTSLSNLRFFSLCLYMGGIISILFYNLCVYFTVRESSYLFYIAYHICAVLLLIPYEGLAHFTPIGDDFAFKTSLFTYSLLGMHVFATLFLNKFLNTREICPPANTAAKIALLSLILSGLLSLFFQYNISFAIVMLFCAFSEIIFFLGIYHVMKIIPSIGLYTSWTLVTAGTLLGILGHLGIFPSSLIAGNLDKFGVAWETIFLSYALGDRLKKMQKEKSIMKEAMSSHCQIAKLNEVFGQVYHNRIGVAQKRLAIVFINVANFSEISTKIGSLKSFYYLKHIHDVIYKTIANHDGVVDRSLGDGTLAVFGIDDDSFHLTDAINRAFLFAIDLQTSLSSRDEEIKIPVALRIGIHVDDVFIGNIGGSQRIDYTIIGAAVNFTKRLETACPHFFIRLSEQIKAHLHKSNYRDQSMSLVHFEVKNSNKVFQAFEYDIYHGRRDDLNKAKQGYYGFFNKTIQEKRVDIEGVDSIFLETSLGHFKITNFSPGGFGIKGQIYISRGVTLLAEISSLDQILKKKLAEKLVDSFYIEIAHGESTENGEFKMGCKIIGLNTRLLTLIYEEIQISMMAYTHLDQFDLVVDL